MKTICAECGRDFNDIRSHLRLHKLTLQEYNAKYNLNVKASQQLVQTVYVIANTHWVYESYIRIHHLRGACVWAKDEQKIRGLPGTTKVVVIEQLAYDSDAWRALQYFMYRGCKINYNLDW